MKIRVDVEKEIDLINTPVMEWPKEAKEIANRVSSKQYVDLRNWIAAGQKEIAKAWLVNFIEREYRKKNHLRNILFLNDLDTK